MSKPPVWLLVCVLLFTAGYALSDVYSYEQLYQADFMIAQEQSPAGDVQFFHLQRIDSTQIDRAALSIDDALPLAAAMRMASLKQARVRVTIEIVEARTLMELKR